MFGMEISTCMHWLSLIHRIHIWQATRWNNPDQDYQAIELPGRDGPASSTFLITDFKASTWQELKGPRRPDGLWFPSIYALVPQTEDASIASSCFPALAGATWKSVEIPALIGSKIFEHLRCFQRSTSTGSSRLTAWDRGFLQFVLLCGPICLPQIWFDMGISWNISPKEVVETSLNLGQEIPTFTICLRAPQGESGDVWAPLLFRRILSFLQNATMCVYVCHSFFPVESLNFNLLKLSH